MPHKLSLTSKKDFEILFKKGKRFYSPNFSIVFLPAPKTRLAYIISKKTAKNANARNYSKRILREIIRNKVVDNLKQKGNFAILIKRNLVELKKEKGFDFLESEVVKLFDWAMK